MPTLMEPIMWLHYKVSLGRKYQARGNVAYSAVVLITTVKRLIAVAHSSQCL
jgi:hypothetical protein